MLGELPNLELQKQLQSVLEQMGKEETKRIAARVKAEEKISLDQKQSAHHAREVRAWEGSKIFIRKKSDGKERKVLCHRVGRAFLSIQEGAKEPIKVKRADLVSIRTSEERLLAILDAKIGNVSKHGMRRLKTTSARLEGFYTAFVKECKEFDEEMENLVAFQSRVYAVLVRKGLIINPSRKGVK